MIVTKAAVCYVAFMKTTKLTSGKVLPFIFTAAFILLPTLLRCLQLPPVSKEELNNRVFKQPKSLRHSKSQAVLNENRLCIDTQ